MRRTPADQHDQRQNPDPEQRQPRRTQQGQRVRQGARRRPQLPKPVGLSDPGQQEREDQSRGAGACGDHHQGAQMDHRGEPDQQEFANSRGQLPVQAVQRMREGVSADEDDEPGDEAIWLLIENGQPTHAQCQGVDQPRTQAAAARGIGRTVLWSGVLGHRGNLSPRSAAAFKQRRSGFCPAGLPRPVLPARQITPPLGPVSGVKIFPFCSHANQFIPVPSCPIRGAARDRHERAVGCGGRRWRAGRTRLTRTAKSCGSGAAVLALSLR